MQSAGHLIGKPRQPEEPGAAEYDEVLKSDQPTLQPQPPQQSAVSAPDRIFQAEILATQVRLLSGLQQLYLCRCTQPSARHSPSTVLPACGSCATGAPLKPSAKVY